MIGVRRWLVFSTNRDAFGWGHVICPLAGLRSGQTPVHIQVADARRRRVSAAIEVPLAVSGCGCARCHVLRATRAANGPTRIAAVVDAELPSWTLTILGHPRIPSTRSPFRPAHDGHGAVDGVIVGVGVARVIGGRVGDGDRGVAIEFKRLTGRTLRHISRERIVGGGDTQPGDAVTVMYASRRIA